MFVRGMGQSGVTQTVLQYPWSPGPTGVATPAPGNIIGPPGSVVVLDAGDGSGNKIAAQLDSTGAVQSMWQLGADGAPSSFSVFASQASGFVEQNKTLLVAVAIFLGVLFILPGGRRK